MPEGAYYYVASGSEYEWTWRNNTAAFSHYQIVPGLDRDGQSFNRDRIPGDEAGLIAISPIACHGISHADAEVATQKGLPWPGPCSLPALTATSRWKKLPLPLQAPRMFQLYLSKNWDFNKMVFDAINAPATRPFC